MNPDYLVHQHNVWLRFAPVVMEVLLALVLAGCGKSPEPGDFSANCSPGEYFDVRARSCTRPANAEDRYRDFLYASISSDRREDVATYQISLTHWTNRQDLAELIADSRIACVNMLQLYFPTLPGGLRSPQYLASSIAKQDAFSTAVGQTAMLLADDAPTVELIKAAVADDSVAVSVMQLSATPSNIAAWWYDNAQAVRLVQPMRGPASGAQRGFEPDEEIR